MDSRLSLNILPQPDEITCGPTCLQAVYAYFGDHLSLDQVIDEVPMLEGGGTLGVWLACHALRRGYRATIYTFKLQLFDPTWLASGGPDPVERLKAQMAVKNDPKLHTASKAYLEFFRLGGKLLLQDLTPALIRRFLKRNRPIITGLSATYLYQSPREFGPKCEYDDIKGEPSGHFVVLCGYDRENRKVMIADPLHTNPIANGHKYSSPISRVINAILLGVLTYDGNLIILEPRHSRKRNYAKSYRRR
ncbi:MAG: C39 family peptidase [Deltaproteobacteria bacterium]|nr:C39 family peptidase [Deltaproteobacteria bacterium]